MANTFTVNLAQQVTSVSIVARDSWPVNGEMRDPRVRGDRLAPAEAGGRATSDEEREKAEIAQLCQTLNCLVSELNRFYEQVLSKHKEEIAKLSVEIANKVLIQKVQKSDYQIESIVKEALKNAPVHQDVLVHLNPQDLSACQKLQQDDPGSAFAGIKFIADPSIGRAECLLETPKGIIKSFIEQHLERISEALMKVE